MSEEDQADVARIHRSIDAARTKYEHVKWRSEEVKTQEPEVDHVVADVKQDLVAEDAEQSSSESAGDGLDVRYCIIRQPMGSKIIV